MDYRVGNRLVVFNGCRGHERERLELTYVKNTADALNWPPLSSILSPIGEVPTRFFLSPLFNRRLFDAESRWICVFFFLVISLLPPPISFVSRPCSCLCLSPACCGAAEQETASLVHRLLLPSLTADADCPCVGNAGGRTAWSSTVTVQGQNISARYWYDGQYINNAKEDAAEVALKIILNQPPRASTVFPGQVYPQPTSPGYGRGAGF